MYRVSLEMGLLHRTEDYQTMMINKYFFCWLYILVALNHYGLVSTIVDIGLSQAGYR